MTIYQKTQRLVWREPCQDHGPHREKWTTKKYTLRSITSTVQLKLCEMQDSCLSARANEIQNYAERNDMKNMKNFYSSLKEVYSPTSAGSSPLLSADGTKFISEKNKILERWAEYFNGVLNRSSSINDKAIEWLPQVPMNESLDVTPTLGEVQIAIHQLFSSKAPGCGISLLSILGKILARVLLNRLNNHLKHGLLLENQCGFHKEHGTVDLVFAANSCKRSVDLTRDSLWKIMAKYSCPEKFITIIRQFPEGMHAKAQENG